MGRNDNGTSMEGNNMEYDSQIAHEIKMHEAIFEAIRDKNPGLAVQSMKYHFDRMVVAKSSNQ